MKALENVAKRRELEETKEKSRASLAVCAVGGRLTHSRLGAKQIGAARRIVGRWDKSTETTACSENQ
jgi:hypothetical protein